MREKNDFYWFTDLIIWMICCDRLLFDHCSQSIKYHGTQIRVKYQISHAVDTNHSLCVDWKNVRFPMEPRIKNWNISRILHTYNIYWAKWKHFILISVICTLLTIYLVPKHISKLKYLHYFQAFVIGSANSSALTVSVFFCCFQFENRHWHVFTCADSSGLRVQ